MSIAVKKPEIRLISVDKLIEDPLNKEAFNEGELDQLIKDIHDKGFFGDVAAFPCGDDLYMLESGHRRTKAAIQAGLKEIPVFITEPPKNEIERRIRLTQWNLNGRNYTPMDVAKLVKFTYDTIALKKENGEISGSLLELTAKELHISTSSVTKYKALLTLPKALQKLAEDGTCSWAVVSTASALPPDGQRALAMRVSGMNKLGVLTTDVLRKEIEEFKHVKLFRPINDANNEISKEKLSAKKSTTTTEKRKRRVDGTKGIIKSWELLKMSLSENALIKGKDEEKIKEYLRDIIELSQKAIDKYSI